MSRKNILYIPLDNRPANLSFVKDLGNVADINIVTPPKEILGYFLERGNCIEISKWMKKSKGDVLIISLDMLLYGGLIASRNPLTEKEEAYSLLNSIKEFKEINPEIKIYAFSNIMRLSISISGDESEVWWRKINKYNELRYKVEILNDISLEGELNKIISEIPEQVLNDYLDSRKRNHIFNMEAVYLVRDNIIDFLILSQEDCSPYGLHWIEHKRLQEEIDKYKLNEKVFIYPGADEIGQMLLSRYINDETNWYPKVYVSYDSEELSDIVAKFEDRPINNNIEEHLKSLGIEVVKNREDSNFILAVTTPHMPYIDMVEDNMEHYNKQKVISDFVSKIKEYIKEDRIVILADLSCANGGDPYLIKELKNAELLLSLVGYSAWNTAGNTLGTAISHGNIISNIMHRGILSVNKSIDSLKFMLERYIDDYIYQSIVRNETAKIVKSENISIFNMESSNEKVNKLLESSLESIAKEYFRGVKVKYIDFNGKINNITIHAVLPWNRVFEVECSLSLELQENYYEN